MTTVATHQGLNDAIAQSRKTIEEWASNQKAAADRISSGAQAEFEAFQKSMDETRASILSLQLESKLCLEGKETSRKRVEREVEERTNSNASLEAVLKEKQEVIACKSHFE